MYTGLLWHSLPLPGDGRNQDQRVRNLHNLKDYPLRTCDPKWKIFERYSKWDPNLKKRGTTRGNSKNNIIQ